MRESTDEALIAELLDGHSEILDELYDRYAKKLFVFCSHTLKSSSAQETEDLVHDIFLRMIKAAHTFDQSKASFRTWLYTIARNCCFDFVRRKSRFSFLPLRGNKSTDDPGVDFEDILEHPDDSIEKQVFDAELFSAISECIQNIKDAEEKQAILLYFLENKVFREIADIIGRSLSTAKNRVGSAQVQVKECLQEKGYSSW